MTGFDQRADALHASIGKVEPRITATLATVRVDIGFDVYAVTPTGQRQVASGIDDLAGGRFYFTELDQETTVRHVAVVSYDATNGYVTLSQSDPGDLCPGSESCATTRERRSSKCCSA